MLRANRYLPSSIALILVLGLAGCGGSGANLPPGSLTGLVTAVDGSPVPGARVFIGRNETVSASNGTWELFEVHAGYNRVRAETTVNGLRWSGETVADVSGGEHNRNMNIVVSDE